MLHMRGTEHDGQPRIRLLPGAGRACRPSVESAARHAQGPAQDGHRVGGLLCLDPGVPRVGALAKWSGPGFSDSRPGAHPVGRELGSVSTVVKTSCPPASVAHLLELLRKCTRVGPLAWRSFPDGRSAAVGKRPPRPRAHGRVCLSCKVNGQEVGGSPASPSPFSTSTRWCRAGWAGGWVGGTRCGWKRGAMGSEAAA
jgi:hypothetical protein